MPLSQSHTSILAPRAGPSRPAVVSGTQLKDMIVQLGPWHLDVEVTSGVSTGMLQASTQSYSPSYGSVPFVSPREYCRALLRRIYPDGLQARSMLDCACNCGGWLFWGKELGAGRCFGFDVRRHWIDQARFLAANRAQSSEGIQFEVLDLYSLPQLCLKPFDITIFNGIFYHLPDPVTGLKIAADLTTELLMVNTATRNDYPDGMLAISTEGREQLMSGIYGLNWYPTGPLVMKQVLNWLGFTETRCVFWHKKTPHQPPELGRLEMIAARTSGILEHFDSQQPSSS